MLAVSHLTKRYGDVTALDGMSFAVEPGQLLGFVGPNGSGKTTTMRAILGLVDLDGGEVRWDGRPVDAGARPRFGYMPEERGLYPRMRVGDQVTYFGRLAGLRAGEARAAARHWLDRLGLGERMGDDVQSLSHGNQQRAQLAVALIHDPDLLVLDEPFSGLDPIAVDALASLLAERAAAGTAVLFSSHQLDLVQHLCREVAIVDRGRVVLAGSVEELRSAAATRSLEIVFDRPVGDGWARSLPGLVPVEVAGASQRFTAPAELDLRATVDAATTAAAVRRLTFEPPGLSDVFRAAVEAPDGPASDDDPARSDRHGAALG